MLTKLLKHDFISLFKKISGLWLIFGAIFAFQILLADVLKMGKAGEGVGNGIIMFFVVAGLSFAGFVISGYWFSSKMYGDEGYLTNTLPAKTWQVVLSKFIVATIVTILSGFFAIVAAAVMASRLLEGFQGIWNLFLNILGEGWHELFQDWFLRAAIDLFMSTFSFLALCLFSISLSNAIDYGNKAVKTILFILGLAILSQMIGNFIIVDEGNVSAMGMFHGIEVFSRAKPFDTHAIVNWFYTGAWILFYFLGTLYISEKHLKLRD